MKRTLVLLSSLALAGLVSLASAHEGEAARDHGAAVDARATTSGSRVEGSVVVPGTVAERKADLYRLERWPRVFSDVRGSTRNGEGSWSVDFRRFGHAHDFHVTRTPAGVVLELAEKGHDRARLEYALEPIDATRSKLTIRLFMTTPPQLTGEQALGLLRDKAQADLDDLAKSPSAR